MPTPKKGWSMQTADRITFTGVQKIAWTALIRTNQLQKGKTHSLAVAALTEPLRHAELFAPWILLMSPWRPWVVCNDDNPSHQQVTQKGSWFVDEDTIDDWCSRNHRCLNTNQSNGFQVVETRASPAFRIPNQSGRLIHLCCCYDLMLGVYMFPTHGGGNFDEKWMIPSASS